MAVVSRHKLAPCVCCLGVNRKTKKKKKKTTERNANQRIGNKVEESDDAHGNVVVVVGGIGCGIANQRRHGGKEGRMGNHDQSLEENHSQHDAFDPSFLRTGGTRTQKMISVKEARISRMQVATTQQCQRVLVAESTPRET